MFCPEELRGAERGKERVERNYWRESEIEREREGEGETSYLVQQTCSDPGLDPGNFKDLPGIECATLVSLTLTLCVTHIRAGTTRGPV